MSIPRMIHYCWLSDDPVPEKMERYIAGWKRILPDYEFIKWDLNSFDKDTSVWVSEAVEKKKYAFASDYIRLWAVYQYGGIYLDMDVEVIKPFDQLLDKANMFAYESPDKKRIEAGCFGAEKNDPFLKACLACYKDRHFIRGDGTFDMLPLSKRMYDIMSRKGFRMDLYPPEYFTAKSYETGIETPGENTYAIHHFAGSWKSREERRIEKRARGIRRAHPIAGGFAAFVYEKTFKAILILKKDGIKELCCRIGQYLKSRYADDRNVWK